MNSIADKHLKIISYLLLISFILIICYVASDIIFPLILAFLIAVMIRPIDNFFQQRLKFPRILAISVTILLATAVLFGFLLFMGLQISTFISDVPQIKESLGYHLVNFNNWCQQNIGFQLVNLKKLEQSSLSNINDVALEYFNTVSNALVFMVLIPIYVFLMLLYRSLLLSFLLKLVPKGEIADLQEVVNDIKVIIRSYITGLLIEVGVVACMTSLGLWLVGVKYFIFLGILTAFLNLIPYVGILIACVFSCVLALINSDHFSIVLWVLLVNVMVQFIDNNILMPKIVGSKVSINALASILAVIVGGALAGMPGMFLAIPVIAILKVIFDKIPQLQPYGYVLGDEIPKAFDWQKIRITRFLIKQETEKNTKEANSSEEEKGNNNSNEPEK